MLYKSTRSDAPARYTAAEVIKMGQAPDGGLFLPETIPTLSPKLVEQLRRDPYPVRAAKILSLFLTDYTYEELLEDASAAYSEASFPGGAAPLVPVKEGLYSLELWHGPTAAFKDMALQLMPRLLSRALKKTGESNTALILVATSGDTGKAALEGYRDVEGIKILVFYPSDGVSRVQKLQMSTQEGSNVGVCAIRGNFDDAQSGVKAMFGDAAMKEELTKRGFFFSSANSINWGRLAPQIVYYVSAYCDLLDRGVCKPGEPFHVTVPTGNFGNIFAAYIAKQMGIPIGRLICASNQNNILTDFLRTGVYDRNRPFHLTMSPSMDILISSNLERLLSLIAGPEKTSVYMQALRDKGVYTVEPEIRDQIGRSFLGYYADEATTARTIKALYEGAHYLCDTHSAVGFSAALDYQKETGDHTPIIVASTASPYKFATDVYTSFTGTAPSDELGALDALAARTETAIPYPLQGLADRTIRFTEIIEVDAMPEAVRRFLQ